MPVVSPSRYSSSSAVGYTSTLTSTYRSSFGGEKPYVRTSSINYSSRSSYNDRWRYDDKRERKNSIDYPRTGRAQSVTDYLPRSLPRAEARVREPSVGRDKPEIRSSRRTFQPSSVLDVSLEDFNNKYSVSNYVPMPHRLNQTSSANNISEISRSKSISSDIGRPPIISDYRSSRKARIASTTNGERSNRSSMSPSRTVRASSVTATLKNHDAKDTNGNDLKPSVAEIRKKFDSKMTVTKLPANDAKSSYKLSESYLNQLKNCHNGSTSYTKICPKKDDVVPVHLPSSSKWDSASSMSNSNSDVSIRTSDSPKDSPKPDRTTIANVKNQIVPNNPINKILEKSTVVKVEGPTLNGDNNVTNIKVGSPVSKIKADIEKQTKSATSELTSYIQISHPIVSASLPNTPIKQSDNINYIDSDENSPIENGFENKVFQHMSISDEASDESPSKQTDTGTESDLTEDSSPDVDARRLSDLEGNMELVGGKASTSTGAGPTSSVRRSSDRDTATSLLNGGGVKASGLNGLRNIGNTCFMNSVIQCLSNTRLLREYVVEDRYLSDINTSLSCMKGALIKAFASVIKELWREGESDCVVNTSALKSQVQRFAPRFMGYSQQDAQEFLRYLLEGLHEDVNRVTTKPKPIHSEIDDSLSDEAKAQEAWNRYLRMEDSRVGDIFVGQLKSTLRCTHCHHDSVTFDPFWDLSLPIPSRTGNVKLQQCLAHFTKEEELDGDEKPTCSKCGVRRKCLKWFTIQKFPKVLVVHLKRFSPTERFRGKLSVVVEFPLNGLDMNPYAANSSSRATYNLYAVSNHSGTTYSGHYTAYCKHPYTGHWHEYNDTRVSPISPRNIVSSEGYVLFYELSGASSHL